MSEVTSVNGMTGTVILTATDVEAIPASEVEQPDGVATLDSSARLREGQLPTSVATASHAALGEVSGVVQLPFAKASTFTAKLTGATEFEPSELPSFKDNATLWVEPNGHTFSIKAITWIGSEPSFKTTGRYAIALFVLEGAVFGIAGIEGPEGKAGNTVHSGEGAPAESVGVSGDYYINTLAHAIYGPKLGSSWGSATSLVGPEGPKGAEGAKGATGPSSVESMLGVLYDVLNGSSLVVNAESSEFKTAKRARFRMMVVPKEGKITKMWIRNGTVAKGNTRVAIFDTGQKAVGEYSLLVQSTEVAQTGTNTWQLIELPEHTYTAGQVIMVAVMNSSTEGSYGTAKAPLVKTTAELPEGALGASVAVAVPKLVAGHTFATFEFAAVAVANLEAEASGGVAMIARVE
ncbi:MAG: hypothetical protein ACLP1Q_01750 [Solirubrobacteraceae bacterium]